MNERLEFGELREFIPVSVETRGELRHIGGDGGQGGTIEIEVIFPPGQKKTALPGFGIEQRVEDVPIQRQKPADPIGLTKGVLQVLRRPIQEPGIGDECGQREQESEQCEVPQFFDWHRKLRRKNRAPSWIAF